MARSGLRGGGPVVHKVDDRVQNMVSASVLLGLRESLRRNFLAQRAQNRVCDGWKTLFSTLLTYRSKSCAILKSFVIATRLDSQVHGIELFIAGTQWYGGPL